MGLSLPFLLLRDATAQEKCSEQGSLYSCTARASSGGGRSRPSAPQPSLPPNSPSPILSSHVATVSPSNRTISPDNTRSSSKEHALRTSPFLAAPPSLQTLPPMSRSSKVAHSRPRLSLAFTSSCKTSLAVVHVCSRRQPSSPPSASPNELQLAHRFTLGSPSFARHHASRLRSLASVRPCHGRSLVESWK